MKPTKNLTLVFVYNAHSGLLNMLKDAVHKTFSPKTYDCKLCDITYSPVRMRSQWKKFVSALPYPVEFSYIDLIENKYRLKQVEYPSAWIESDGKLSPWLSATEIKQCQTLEQLQQLVLAKLPDDQAEQESTPQPVASQ